MEAGPTHADPRSEFDGPVIRVDSAERPDIPTEQTGKKTAGPLPFLQKGRGICSSYTLRTSNGKSKSPASAIAVAAPFIEGGDSKGRSWEGREPGLTVMEPKLTRTPRKTIQNASSESHREAGVATTARCMQ